MSMSLMHSSWSVSWGASPPPRMSIVHTVPSQAWAQTSGRYHMRMCDVKDYTQIFNSLNILNTTANMFLKCLETGNKISMDPPREHSYSELPFSPMLWRHCLMYPSRGPCFRDTVS